MVRKKRIGLALGGGGARGFAHLGVLRALDSFDIEADVFSGTSMGAIIMVAHLQRRTFGQSENSLRKFVREYSRRFASIDFIDTEEYQRRNILRGLVQTTKKVLKLGSLAARVFMDSGKVISDISKDFIYPCNLEELPKKAFVCAADVVSGQGVFMSRGNAQSAIRASMSIAGSFPGVPLGDRILVDASAAFPVPIQAFQFDHVDYVIASDVGIDMAVGYHPASALDLLLRQYDMLYGHVASEVSHCSDYVIRPDLGDTHWTDFGKLDAILEQGYEAGLEAGPEIRSMLESDTPTVPISERPWHCSGYRIAPVAEDHFPSIPK